MASIVQEYYSNVTTKTPVPAMLGIARIAPQNADAKIFITNADASALWTFDASGSTFSARSAGGQGATNNTWAKVQCNNVSAPGWNIDGYYNTTLYRFLPLRPGYYQVNWQVGALATGLGNITTLQAGIYKNGALFRSILQSGGGQTTSAAQISTLVPLNGTTDYIEPWGNIGIGGLGGANFDVSFFDAIYIRGL